MLRGPSFNKDKQMRERLNQFNLKNRDGKAPMSEDRMNTAPQNATIPRINHVNIDLPEEDSDTDSYTSYQDNDDNIQKGEYSDSEMDDDMLPQPSTSSCKTLLKSPKTNSSMTETNKMYEKIGTEDMNRISSFRLKIE